MGLVALNDAVLPEVKSFAIIAKKTARSKAAHTRWMTASGWFGVCWLYCSRACSMLSSTVFWSWHITRTTAPFFRVLIWAALAIAYWSAR